MIHSALLLISCILQYDHRAPEVKAPRVAVSESVPVVQNVINKVDDRSLLNWDKNSNKMPKKDSPNLAGFNATEYIATGHVDTDSYKLNAFNQAESDKLQSDRAVPDTRNYQ